jgi:hypothetical protein
METSKIFLYVKFLAAFILAQSMSMWGAFYTLKYPNLSMVKAFAMAIPFAWLDWAFMTYAIDISHTNKLVTEVQDIFILTITQFTAVLTLNHFFLKQALSRSDILAFFIILGAILISYNKMVSKLLGRDNSSTKDEQADDIKLE